MPRGQVQFCPIEGCTNIRPAKYVMCRKHWRRVSATTRQSVYSAWALWKGRDRSVLSHTEVDALWQSYATVRQDALDEAAA